MAQQTHNHFSRSVEGAFPEFDDAKLRSTMQDFLREEKPEESNIWNIATIAGLAMFLVCMAYILQLIGLQIIPGLSEIFTPLAIAGALLVGFVGFGFLVGDRKRIKEIIEKRREQRADYFEEEFPADEFDAEEDIDLEKELFGDHASEKKSGKGAQYPFDNYALRQSKKLYKSRSDRKIAGVCGGLAKYFGISATVIRVLFIVTFFAGSGASLLIYIALAIALDKEPRELADDYNF
ncbi:MAG TPA: PspC domain-containing protein [Balneolaceae bacterium]|nr:PspC domain-containing protein [Balneolaceae bacterium]